MKLNSLAGTTALATIVLLSATSVLAVELPARKVGLWETSSLSSHQPGMPVRVQMCFEAGTEHELSVRAEASLKKMGCHSNPLQFVGGNYIYDSTCKLGANTMKTHSIISYSRDGTTHGETTMDMGDGASPSTMSSDSKWIGACKPGQKPGQGEIMNMDEFRKGKK